MCATGSLLPVLCLFVDRHGTTSRPWHIVAHGGRRDTRRTPTGEQSTAAHATRTCEAMGRTYHARAGRVAGRVVGRTVALLIRLSSSSRFGWSGSRSSVIWYWIAASFGWLFSSSACPSFR